MKQWSFLHNYNIKTILDIGGKLCGAGGGFMLFFAPPEVQPEIREKLNKLLYVPILFEKLGSHVILYSTQDV